MMNKILQEDHKEHMEISALMHIVCMQSVQIIKVHYIIIATLSDSDPERRDSGAAVPKRRGVCDSGPKRRGFCDSGPKRRGVCDSDLDIDWWKSRV